MEKLKSREHYEDLYDKHTVERCRWHRDFKPNFDEIPDSDFKDIKKTPKNTEVLRKIKTNWAGLVGELSTWFYAAERYNQKSSTIDEWERRDQEHDEEIAKIEPPGHVRCRECLSTDLRLISKDEYWRADKRHQMLFMYKCNKCNTNTAFYETGEQHHVKPPLCPKCRHDKQTFTRKETKNKLMINYTCSACSHTWTEELDFTPAKPEKPDPDYLADRKLYCYSDKVRTWAEQSIGASYRLKSLFPDEEETKAAEDLKTLLATIKRLTIGQVTDMLDKLMVEAGYKNFQLGQPDMGNQVVVPFNLIDDKARSADESRQELYKLITKELEGTNWRLSRSSLDYRMGYLTGKLKVYESEADLRSLVEKKTKKSNSQG